MIVFIPARKGSTRLPGKSTKPLHGKPLIQWTFDAAKNHGVEVIVSSDDEEVLHLATMNGFTTFLRPPELCDEKAKMSDVLFHHLRDFKGHNVCVLYPTSPLRKHELVQQAITMFHVINRGSYTKRSVMSVSEVRHRPYGLMEIERTQFGGRLKCRDARGEEFYQGQNTPVCYRANGAIYVIPNVLLENRGINSQLFNGETCGFVMDDVSSQEVDAEQDFVVAEALMRWRESL